MIVLVISSLCRNLIEIFMNDGEQSTADEIDLAFFYLQTCTFMLSVVISFIHPVIIKSQLIIPLPSVPEMIENLNTAIIGNLHYFTHRTAWFPVLLRMVRKNFPKIPKIPELILQNPVLHKLNQ